MKTLLHHFSFFYFALFVLAFSENSNAQCTIASTTNASSLTCGSGSINVCNGILYIGDGTTFMSLIMNAALDLSCLGPIQLIIRNNAAIDFSSGNDYLTLANGSSLALEGSGTLIGGSCNASERIYIGGNLLASCNGNAGADYSFPTLIAAGGYSPISVAASPSSICNSGTSTITATANPSSGATYKWYTVSSGGSAIFTGNPYSTGTISTSTTYYVEANYSTYSTVRKAVTVTVNPLPSVPTIATTAATCSAAGTSTISNYSSSNTYTFTPATAGITINGTGLISGMTIGTSYTVTSKNGSCTSTASSTFSNAAMLTTPAVPTIATTAATCSAAGTSTISNYSSSNTYTFTPAAPTAGALGLISGMTIGTSYTVTSKNGSCTSGSSASFSNAVMLSTPAVPTISAGGPTTFCAGGSVTLTSSVGSTYLWSTGATTQSINPTTSGNYTVKVTNSSGCISASSVATTVIVNALPTITTQPINQLDCELASVNFTVIATGSGLTYLWQYKKPGDSSFTNITSATTNVSNFDKNIITITNVGSAQFPDGTQYQVVISNGNCSVTSSVAILSVNQITGISPISTNVTQCYSTNYSYTVSTSYPTNVVSYQWKSSVASGSWNNVVDGTHFSGATTATLNIINGTPTESAGYRVYITFHSSGADCNASSTSRTRSITFLPQLLTPVTTVVQPNCTTATGTITVTIQSASDTYSFDNGISYQSSNVKSSLAAGNYNVFIKNIKNCISSVTSVTINPQPSTPSAPTPATPTQPTCALATGSVVLSGLPASGTINQTGFATASYVITGTTMTLSRLAIGTYNFTATNASGCISSASANVTISPLITNTYTTSWDNGIPNGDQNIVFDGAFSSTGDVTACSCLVKAGRNVTINPLHTLTITNAVTVEPTGILKFKSDFNPPLSNSASLVQINNISNSGNIIYERLTNTVIRNTDYTYWSSPVAAFTLGAVSPNTLAGKFYSFDDIAQDWKQESSATTMFAGRGYLIRGPEFSSVPPPPSPYLATFVGVPNNGPITLSNVTADNLYLLGNPFPSAINADTFLNENSGVLDGTLYFWTHNTEIDLASSTSNPGSGLYAYSSDDYASYNLTGGVGTASALSDPSYPSGKIPDGKIPAGQGFFGSSIVAPSGNTIVYNNTIRVAGSSGNNSQFFKTSSTKTKTTNAIEKDRIWLDLTNTQGAFKQTLVGYVTDATNGYENRFDGESFDGNDFIDFYSVLQDKNLTIQGRALPFDENDTVQLGYKSTIKGNFAISIDQTDGVLTNQAVYIEDKLTNTIADLRSSPYAFTTVAGTFNDRFLLRYVNNSNDKTLGTANFETASNTVLVSTKNKVITVHSFAQAIDAVTIYDLTGRLMYQKTEVNSNEFLITNRMASHQVLVVKTSLQNGTTVTDKIIY